ncbi:MAG: hypothetical protein EA378_00895 [Phycisphaerales bacterium]|nr:MAG: hypothetical protein EA378_00895 [Phycisphaerales bacterium]
MIGDSPILSVPAVPVGARTGAATHGVADRQRSFAGILATDQRLQGGVGGDAKSRAREAAEQLVSITFVQPILAQMRASEGAAAPFKPTPGEKQFGALLDAELAQQVTKAARFSLVDRVAQDLLRQSSALEEIQNRRLQDGIDA